MPIYSDVITRLDERAAQVAADQIERHFGDAGRGASTALQREIGSGLTGLRGLVDEFGSGLRSGIDSQLSGVGGSFDAVSSKVSGIGVAGLAAVGGVAAIGTAAAVVGKQFYDLGAQWDSIADGITVRTGKIGAELKALTDVVGDVGSSTAASLGSIGDIVGQISQSMPDLAQNNDAVRQMASNLAYLDANGQAVNIRELGKAFTVFNVNAADQVSTFDQLAEVSRDTGIPINQLIGTVKDGAPQFKQFGLDVGGATGLIAAFEDAGLNSGVAVTGLRFALAKVGDDARGAGPALADAVTQIKALHDAGQESGALQLAQDTFGTKNFAPILDAIENSRISAEGLNKVLEQTGLTLAQMQSATDDGAQGFTKLKNTAATMLKPIGDFLFSNVNQPLLQIADNIDKLIHQPTSPITPDSPLGRMLLPAGGPPGTAGNPLETGIGSGFGPIATPGPATGPSWGPRGGIFADPSAGGGTGAGPKLPSAPVVPYDTMLPPGFAGLPQTAELYSAESSFLDARHSAAEKRARLNQLERDNAATADDITNARNDVLEAERGQNEAELRLYNTQNKQLKDHTAALGEFGAKLDQDLGISKGLAGIADNLVRFLGNLALAPAMAQMNAISAASPSQGGFGLIGMMGAQGVFGPQFTGIDYSKQGAPGYGPSPMGPAGLQPGGVGLPTSGLPDAHGAHPQIAQIAAIAQSFGLKLTAGKDDHANDGGFHPAGMAGDFSNSSGNSAQELAFAKYMADNFGGSLQELIYSDPNFSQLIGGGKNVSGTGYYSPGVLGDHTDHVHVAMTDQAASALSGMSTYAPSGGAPTGPTGPISSFGAPGSKQAIANMVYQQALARGYSPHEAQSILAYAIGESGLNAGISGGVQGGGGDPFADTVQGLFQQKPAFAQGGGISPGQRGDPVANTTAYLNQLEKHRDLPIEQALPATSVGGPLAPGGYQPWAPLMSQAQGYIGSSGPGPLPNIIPGSGGEGFLGLGGGPSLSPAPGAGRQPWWTGGTGPGLPPGVSAPSPGAPGFGTGAGGPGVGPTTIGGVDPLQGTGKGGIGMTPGGSLDTALGIGASMFPGLGQAAQTGVKLASRAIQYGGQVAGIMTQGALDTFLPMGGSQLAQNSWLTRIVGGLAGAAPALPNMAGKSSQPQGPKPEAVLDPNAPQQPQGGDGQKPGQTNITVHNQRATEDGTGRDIAHAMQNQYAMPGMP